MTYNLKERPNYIDFAKGLAMFAVILGHFVYCFNVPFSPNTPVTKLSHFVTLFHMPFFFIVTGMVSSFYVANFVDFVKKQIKFLFVPYLLFGLILGGLWTFMNFVKTGDGMLFAKFIFALASGSDFKGCSLGWASQLWFVYALFFIKLLIGFGFSQKQKFFRYLYFGVIFAGGGLIMFSSINPLPFRIDCVLVGCIFVLMGYNLKSFLQKMFETKKNAFVSFCISIVFVGLFELFYIDNSIRQCLSINVNYFGRFPLLFFLSGLSGTIMLLSLSRLVFFKRKFILVMSNGLIAYLALHKVLFFVLNCFYYTDTIVGMVFTSAAVFALCYPLTELLNRYAPILLGFRK